MSIEKTEIDINTDYYFVLKQEEAMLLYKTHPDINLTSYYNEIIMEIKDKLYREDEGDKSINVLIDIIFDEIRGLATKIDSNKRIGQYGGGSSEKKVVHYDRRKESHSIQQYKDTVTDAEDNLRHYYIWFLIHFSTELIQYRFMSKHIIESFRLVGNIAGDIFSWFSDSQEYPSCDTYHPEIYQVQGKGAGKIHLPYNWMEGWSNEKVALCNSKQRGEGTALARVDATVDDESICETGKWGEGRHFYGTKPNTWGDLFGGVKDESGLTHDDLQAKCVVRSGIGGKMSEAYNTAGWVAGLPVVGGGILMLTCIVWIHGDIRYNFIDRPIISLHSLTSGIMKRNSLMRRLKNGTISGPEWRDGLKELEQEEEIRNKSIIQTALKVKQSLEDKTGKVSSRFSSSPHPIEVPPQEVPLRESGNDSINSGDMVAQLIPREGGVEQIEGSRGGGKKKKPVKKKKVNRSRKIQKNKKIGTTKKAQGKSNLSLRLKDSCRNECNRTKKVFPSIAKKLGVKMKLDKKEVDRRIKEFNTHCESNCISLAEDKGIINNIIKGKNR